MSNNYYHQYYFGNPNAKATKNLIIINCVVYFLQLFLNILKLDSYLLPFMLIPQFVVNKLFLWQLVTYMFLHGGFFHLVFNLLALWMFGSEIEVYMGRRKYWFFYIYCGIGAAITTCVFAFNLPPTIGASGAIFGLLTAFGIFFPERIILVFFVIPMKAKWFVIIFGIFELMSCLSSTANGIAYFAHIGGMIFAFIFIKSDIFLPVYAVKVYRRKLEKLKKEKEGMWSKVDEILDKVNKEGLHRLTKAERNFLKNIKKYK